MAKDKKKIDRVAVPRTTIPASTTAPAPASMTAPAPASMTAPAPASMTAPAPASTIYRALVDLEFARGHVRELASFEHDPSLTDLDRKNARYALLRLDPATRPVLKPLSKTPPPTEPPTIGLRVLQRAEKDYEYFDKNRHRLEYALQYARPADRIPVRGVFEHWKTKPTRELVEEARWRHNSRYRMVEPMHPSREVEPDVVMGPDGLPRLAPIQLQSFDQLLDDGIDE